MVVSIERDGAAGARRALERCMADAGVALFPADTLYGLGCDPANTAAIDRIHELKGRDERKPSAVMFFDPLAMRDLLPALGPRTREAIAVLLPGPVTVVVDNPEHRYRLASRDDPGRLGLRLLAGPLAGARCAIFQTSANSSGEPAPSRFEDVDPAIVTAVDLAIDGGALGGRPSTVVDLSRLDDDASWRVLREGALSRAELHRRLSGAASET
jgi:L-threonylcarbamoyladenylate synthase